MTGHGNEILEKIVVLEKVRVAVNRLNDTLGELPAFMVVKEDRLSEVLLDCIRSTAKMTARVSCLRDQLEVERERDED